MPVTAPLAADSVKVDAVIVAVFIAVLKVAVTADVVATPVAALAGVVDDTVGGCGGGGVWVLVFELPPQPAIKETAATSQPAERDRILNFSLNQIDGALRSSRYNFARGKGLIPRAEFTAFS